MESHKLGLSLLLVLLVDSGAKMMLMIVAVRQQNVFLE